MTLVIAVEPIPDPDTVTRLVIRPRMGDFEAGLIFDSIFLFQDKDQNRLSVIWRKYASTSDAVHRIGRWKQGLERDKKAAQGKPEDSTYIGFLSAISGEIRDYKSTRHYRFSVTHEPLEGQPEHAEIGIIGDRPRKSDKLELRSQLKVAFRHSQPYTTETE